jgi:polysaccharide biosynthesis protein PelA
MKKNFWPKSRNCCTDNLPWSLSFFLSLGVLLCLAATSWAAPRDNSLQSVKKWFILLNYDPQRFGVNPGQVQAYDLVIIDADQHPALDLFKPTAFRIAYVSMGEAEVYRFYWPQIQGTSFVLEENPNWAGNFYVDVRDSSWQALIIDTVISKIVQAGFQGIMLDTLDTAEFLEDRDPEKFYGMRAAMTAFVKKVHEKYPGLLLISNNGFALLPELAPFLSAMLVEDVYRMPDFEKGGYTDVPQADREYKIKTLVQLQRAYHLPVFNIEYVSRTDKKNIRFCLRASRRLGFKPYVAEKELREIYLNAE